jgi:hypothetical protein
VLKDRGSPVSGSVHARVVTMVVSGLSGFLTIMRMQLLFSSATKILSCSSMTTEAGLENMAVLPGPSMCPSSEEFPATVVT